MSDVKDMSHTDANCLFCKIVQGQIPSRLVYEDADMFAFHDISPGAPVHFLIVPKLHMASLDHAQPEQTALLGRMLAKVPELAKAQGCGPYPEGGHRVVINTGEEGGQEVHHLHMHVMGGPRPWLKG